MKENLLLEKHVVYNSFRAAGVGKTKCEDVLLINESPEMWFFGLADGQSGKKFCIEGGTAALSALEQFMRRESIADMTAHPFPDELQLMLIKTLRSRLLELATEEGEFKDYSSTLLALAIDPRSKKFVCVHIGDGAAIGIRDDDEIFFISAQENGSLPSHCYLTTSENAAKHLRLSFGTIENLRRITIVSDGVRALCCGKNICRRAKELLLWRQQDEIITLLDSTQHFDDAACILLDFSEKGDER